MLRKLAVWLGLGIVILLFYLFYEKPKREQEKVAAFLSKGKPAIEVTGFSYRKSEQGAVTQAVLRRTSKYPDEMVKDANEKAKDDKAFPSDVVKYLPAGFIKYWELVEKPGLPLKEGLIAQVIGSLLTLELKNPIKPEEQEALDRYGLDNPERSVSVHFEDGKSLELSISPLNSDFGVYYVKVDGDPNVYPVSELDLEFLTLDLEKLHAKSVFSTVITNVEEITLESSGSSFSVELKKMSDPKIVKPFTGKASVKSLQDIFDELRSMMAEEWLSYGPEFNLSKYGLDKPLVYFQIKEKNKNEKLEVRLGYQPGQNNKPVGYVSTYNAVFKPSLDPIQRLIKHISNLRETKHFRFSIFDVTKFVVNDRHFVYRDMKWFEGTKEYPSDAVEKLLTSLKEFEAIRFLDSKTLTQPEMSIEVSTNTGDNYKCQIGMSQTKERVVECDEFFVISENKFQEFKSALENLK